MLMTETTPPRTRFAPLLDQDGAPVVTPRALLGPAPEATWGDAESPPAALTIDEGLMRGLASKILAAGHAGLVKAGIAAVQHGAGVTTVARSVAACLAAQFSRRVVLVEANIRSPSLRALCGLSAGPGLGDVFSGAASLEMALRAAPAGKMLVLPAGGALPGGERLARAMTQLAAELFQYADTLLFDLPPLLAYPDGALMGRALDGVAVVMRARQTTRRDGAQAVELLTTAGIPVLGAVLNRHRK